LATSRPHSCSDQSLVRSIWPIALLLELGASRKLVFRLHGERLDAQRKLRFQ
jgi:hypothetical protein